MVIVDESHRRGTGTQVSPLLLLREVVTVKDQGGNGRGGKWKWCREHCWHGWGKGTKGNHAPRSPLSESTQFHMAHVMILIITFTESFSH